MCSPVPALLLGSADLSSFVLECRASRDDGASPQATIARKPRAAERERLENARTGSDRATPMGRPDYAILMMLAKLGLRANEVATLTLDDIDWRAGEMLVRAKGRQRARMPIPPDVGAAIVAYLRNGAQSRRAGGCSSARSRRMSALLLGVRSR
jgi:integrase